MEKEAPTLEVDQDPDSSVVVLGEINGSEVLPMEGEAVVIQRRSRKPLIPGEAVRSKEGNKEPPLDLSRRIGVGIFRNNSETHDSYDVVEEEMRGEFYEKMLSFPLLNRALEKKLFEGIEEGASVEDLRGDQEFRDLFELEREDTEEELQEKIENLLDESKTLQEVVVHSNLRLALSVALKYRGTLPISELTSLGNLGIIRAIETFDYREDTKFSTYATWWIRQRIVNGINDTANTVRLPIHLEETLLVIKRFINGYVVVNGQNPTIEEVIDEIKSGTKSKPSIKSVIRAAISGSLKNLESTDLPLATADGDGSMTLIDVIPNSNPEVDTQEAAIQNIETMEIKKAMSTALNAKQKRILDLRFGFEDGEAHTLEDIGKEFGVTRERIRQIQNEALGKLRKQLSNTGYSKKDLEL